ncbi:MAG: hypothetical protein AAB554_04000 [Patescibacteria group bacterium]
MVDKKHLLKDFGVIALSLLLAIALERSGLVEHLLTATPKLRVIGSFFAGMFFTSIFTTAPAIVALGEIARSGSVLATAAVGALGSVVGDMLIFSLVRDRLSEHLMEHLKDSEGWARFAVLIRTRSFRLASLFIGGLIIASPFPDELGISLMGFSKMKMRWFVPLSYSFNFAGILIIGLAAKAIA